VRRRLSGAALGGADEASIVALAIFADDAAFSELVRRRQSWLRNLLRRLCRDPVLADDLAQQVFLQAWRSIGTLNSAGAFGAWLRRLAVNTWLMHVRTQSPEVPDTSRPEASELPSTGERLDLDRALAHLVPEVRLCIVLAYNEGMSHAEISESTGLPLGTVKSHIRRGAARLRTDLEAYRSNEAHRHAR